VAELLILISFNFGKWRWTPMFDSAKESFLTLTLFAELLSLGAIGKLADIVLKNSSLLGKMEWKELPGNPDETSKEHQIPAEVFLFPPTINLEILNFKIRFPRAIFACEDDTRVLPGRFNRKNFLLFVLEGDF
jgi:hypothetical protein